MEIKKTIEPEKTSVFNTKLKGKYIDKIGRRKSATARIRLYKNGSGIFLVNEEGKEYFNLEHEQIAKQPLKFANRLKDFDITVMSKGGGKKCQAEAVRHAISLALIEIDPEIKPALKVKGWTTRDSRIKERKKPGLKKARKAPQWAKR